MNDDSTPKSPEEIPDYQPDQLDYIKAADLEGRRFVVRSYILKPSDFDDGDAAHVTIEMDDQKYLWVTSAKVIQDQLAKATLPFRAKLIQKQGKKYRYWSFA